MLTKYTKTILLGFVALITIAPVLTHAADETQATYKLISPADQEHKILPKTCSVCHKDEELHFLLLTAPSKMGLDLARERLFLGTDKRVSQKRQNPHAKIICLFCHLAKPQHGQSVEGMEFRTADGEPTDSSALERLCLLCHVKGASKHNRVLGEGDSSSDLVSAGLTKEGQPTPCSGCHDMHSEETGPANTSKKFTEFASNSIHVFPHGNKAACVACHPAEMDTEGEAVFLDPDPNKRCKRCHPDGHSNVHPVEVASTKNTYPMDFLDFPLGEEGKMTCSTCHDEPCRFRIEPSNKIFLRQGPYSPMTEFCYKCHPQTGDGSLNPHKQVDSKGNVMASSCVFCHVKPVGDVTRGEVDIASTLGYLQSSLELCLGCHDTPNHPSGINHLVEISTKKHDKLNAYQKLHGVLLPLEDESRIVCTTCHNPHAKGVLEGQAALGAGEEHGWRVPSFAELCTPCHQRYD